MTLTAQEVYEQAASVRSQTGVDPAIIATIVQTESSLGASPPFTLGITSAAARGGMGSSGGVLASPNNYGGTQPSGFFSYQNGAEAAQAFANYIHAYQPALVPYLNNALEFFNPTGPIASSNYYVPTAAEAARAGGAGQATANYYSHWWAIASNFPTDVTGSAPIVPSPTSTDTVTTGADSSSGGANAFQLIPGFSGPLGLNWPGVKISSGFLWAALLFVGGVAAIVIGLLIYFHKEIAETSVQVARAAAVAG